MSSPRSALLAALALTVALVSLTSAEASAQKWETISKEKGVIVKQKDIEGRALPIFRGTTIIKANVVDILAVLNDTPNNTKWMHNCAEARLLKKINDYERIVYNRTDAPWPVDDRDVVVKSKVSIKKEKRLVVVNFQSINSPLQGPVADVVRMPRLRGFYRFKILDEGKTRVTYQIDANPGGWLPDWLVSATSKEIPMNTLAKLRGRVYKMKKTNTYKDFKAKWRPLFEEAAEEVANQ